MMTTATIYQHGPDSQRKEGVPQGSITPFQHVPDALRWLWRKE